MNTYRVSIRTQYLTTYLTTVVIEVTASNEYELRNKCKTLYPDGCILEFTKIIPFSFIHHV